MTELKNPIAKWAFETLKTYSGILFPDYVEIKANAKTLDLIDSGIDFKTYDEARFRAFAQAVEVAGRLELVARRYDLGDLPSVDDGVSFATHAAAMMADPVRVDALTAAVNEVCSCGGGPPGACCQACEVYRRQTRPTRRAPQAMDKPKKPRMITVTIGGVEFPAVSPRPHDEAEERLRAELEILLSSITWTDESPYTCSKCHMFDPDSSACQNPVTIFETEPGGYCAMFAPSPLTDPDDPRAWLVLGKLKGIKKR
jgi:hypothetical protein